MKAGFFPHYQHAYSPFYNERPSSDVDVLVIHNISLPAGQFSTPYVHDLFMGRLDCRAEKSFSDLQGLEVSAHFFIDRQGGVTQFVALDKRAWHAGVSSFEGRVGCNDFSIGIEMEGVDDIAYTALQYQALITLSLEIIAQYPAIVLNNIVGHCDIAAGRKTDPGPAFDWGYYKSELAKYLNHMTFIHD